MFRFIDDVGKRLARPVVDLGDVRRVVETLRELRAREADVDMTIDPIEVSSLSSAACFITRATLC